MRKLLGDIFPERDLFFFDKDGEEAPQTGAATRGGHFHGDGGGVGGSSPNPKRSKFQKEIGGEEGSIHGGVVSSFLAKVNMETTIFQNEARFGKKNSKGKGGERKQYGSKECRDSIKDNEGRFSPKNKSSQLADDVDKGIRWGEKGAGGWVCSSPKKTKSPTTYSGPMLADVARTIQTARQSVMEKLVGNDEELLADQTAEQLNKGIPSSDAMVNIGKKRN